MNVELGIIRIEAAVAFLKEISWHVPERTTIILRIADFLTKIFNTSLLNMKHTETNGDSKPSL